MNIMEEFLKYQHVEHVKKKPISKIEYEKVLVLAIQLSYQLLEVGKDVVGNALDDDCIKCVKHLQLIAEKELSLLHQTLAEE
ncbi:hypothetical protein [Bacillus cereus]|uniref:hypothetical protein n=1 Tax=Bacillus cereus TaxID=1396 RepID=UPI002D78E1C8|nr:hypothetical protein [Bacillus cereus]